MAEGDDLPNKSLIDVHQTTNARAWAQVFCDRFRIAREEGGWVDDPEALMIGWFANAIETGRMAGRNGVWWPARDGRVEHTEEVEQ